MVVAKTLILAVLAFWLTIRLTGHYGHWCPSKLCAGNALDFGLPLFAGALALAVVGALCLSYLPNREGFAGDLPLFPAVLTGLTVLMGYVYVRSLFNHLVVDMPVSRFEIGTLAVLCAVAWYRSKRVVGSVVRAYPNSGYRQLIIDLALLLAICLLIADREMPRDVMLSTDPDLHAYMGHQMTRFGAVPYHQREWGPEAFNYPAGSGTLLFLWHLLSGIDVRNLVNAMPILFTLVGALIVAECLTAQLRSPSHRLLVQLAAITLTAANFVLPLYAGNEHMSGSARLMSIGFVALFLWLIFPVYRSKDDWSWSGIVLAGMTIFVLCSLNPANLIVPGGQLFALVVYRVFSGRPFLKSTWVLVFGLGLIVLDPYYQGLLQIVEKARTDTVGYDDSLPIKPGAQVVSDAIHQWSTGWKTYPKELTALYSEQGIPFFLTFVAGLLLCLGIVRRRLPFSWAAFAALLAFLLSFYLVYGFAQSLSNDRRFYLLSPYVYFNLTQYKSLWIVLALAALLSSLALARVHRMWILVAAFALILPMNSMVRGYQDMYLDPRRDYCGASGCVADADRALLKKIEAKVRSGELRKDGPASKVLLANLVVQMNREKWAFPVFSARVYPHYDVPPAAFFYYQGDVEYSTNSYVKRVCDRLDREWLKSKGIGYVYLPSEHLGTCLEHLPKQEEIVLQEGNAYFLKLREKL